MNIYIGEPVEVSDMQGPCPDGFHVPTKDELTSVNNILKLWNTYSWNLWRVYLHMPYAASMSATSGGIVGGGSTAYYWSSTFSGDRPVSLYMQSNKLDIQPDYYTTNGMSIRPFKDEPVAADSNWTLEFQGTWGGGIYHNSTLGLISISRDGSTWITIADKNLGATVVYNDGDTLSAENCGKYYQRGNNYGFPKSGATTTSTTLVNASSYGPGNYYNSDTFIKSGVSNWDSSNNANLRGGVSQGTSTKSVEVKNIYIGKKPYDGDELCFTANTANSTVILNKIGSPTSVTLETSNDGYSWSTYTFGDTITLSNIGDKVYWRNTSTTDTGFSTSIGNYYQFVMTGSISGSGDITSLLNKYLTTSISDYAFYRLFYNCTALTKSPDILATILGQQCCRQMFEGCTSITGISEIKATTLGTLSCGFMYQGCTALETLPKLPATTLGQQCYRSMFINCSKIKLSSTQTGEYQTAYRIPTTGTGTDGVNSLYAMFDNTGGSFTGTPTINTTYYTSNTVV